jgi:hypothetical protein
MAPHRPGGQGQAGHSDVHATIPGRPWSVWFILIVPVAVASMFIWINYGLGRMAPSPKTSPNESVSFKSAGSSFRRWQALSGTITATDQRLYFVPHRFVGSRRRALFEASISREDISSVQHLQAGSTAGRESGLASLFRPQLRISTPDRSWVFASWNIEELRTDLAQ